MEAFSGERGCVWRTRIGNRGTLFPLVGIRDVPKSQRHIGKAKVNVEYTAKRIAKGERDSEEQEKERRSKKKTNGAHEDLDCATIRYHSLEMED